MPANNPAPSPPGDAHLTPGDRALAEALGRERRTRRRLLVLSPLLVLALAGAGAMAVLWHSAVAESRRLAEQTLNAERAQAEAERGRARAAQVEAERARADAEAARRQVEALQYAHAIHLAQQALSAQDTHRARELLEGAWPEPRGWEWHYLSRLQASPPGAKK
jgi:hypothetical protein